MSRNKYLVRRIQGHAFFFKFDDEAPDLLHVYVRHLTEPNHAITTFFKGNSVWNKKYERFETATEEFMVYWLWLDEKAKKVLIISCFTL